VAPLASIVIPAHDEEAVLGRCLAALRVGAPPDAFEVVVVCNGCRDRSAEVARRAGVVVLETAERGKPAALNLGDAAATAFPRFYLDADVEVTGAALADVARVLSSGRALAAAPCLELDYAGVSLASRAYHAVWRRLPYVRERHVGSGVVGLSAEGRRRFDRFPDAIADDLFLYHLFAPHERLTVASATFTVRPARTLAELVRRKTRVHAGNAELRGRGLAPHAGTQTAWVRVVLARPWLLPCAPVYLGVSLASQLRARRKLRSGALGVWERDESSRAPG
jgi:glycosyltransferase involved in cell wall biosynthesis